LWWEEDVEDTSDDGG
jgi:adenine-specific DNA methylase